MLKPSFCVRPQVYVNYMYIPKGVYIVGWRQNRQEENAHKHIGSVIVDLSTKSRGHPFSRMRVPWLTLLLLLLRLPD